MAPLSFEIEDLFEKPIKSEKLPTCHPKILALKKGLQNCRGAIDETPRGSIELNFPIPVQTAENSILRNGEKNEDGTTVLVIELKAYENSYTVKQEDQAVKFVL